MFVMNEWRAVMLDNERTVKFDCPKCHETGYLTDHEISADGVVTPSVQCAAEGCEFHENITLAGWHESSR